AARLAPRLALDRAITDVLAPERAIPRDLRDRVVRAALRGADRVADADRAEHAAAVGYDVAAREPRARVEDLDVAARDAIEAADRLALLVRVGITAAREHDADRGARIPIDRLVAERAIEGREAETHEIRAQAKQYRLRLGVAEPTVELDDFRLSGGID